jgi:hypothetical protein
VLIVISACIDTYTPFVSACKVDSSCITIGNSINNQVLLHKTCQKTRTCFPMIGMIDGYRF